MRTSPQTLSGYSAVLKVFSPLKLLSGLCFTATLWSPLTSAIAQESNIAMWKVQSAQNTLYLLGSVHMGDNCTLSSPRIDQAMAEAEHTVFEIDLSQITAADQLQLGLELVSVGRLRPGDRTLKERVSPAFYQKISDKFDAVKPSYLQISLDDVNQLYRPTFIALQMQGFQTQTLGLQGSCGVDKILSDRAIAENKTILALETLEEQTQLLKSVLEFSTQQNLEQQFQTLLSETHPNQVNTLLTSVLEGNIQEVEKIVKESCTPTPELCTQILDDRNQAWMAQLNQYLQDNEDYFVIVGAAHLVGPNSVIDLLQQQNYQVEPF